MSRAPALALIAVALIACKEKREPSAVRSPDAAPGKVPAAPDAGATSSPDTPDAPADPAAELPPAPPPEAATADDCKVTGEFARDTLVAGALERGVGTDKMASIGAELTAAFIEACQRDGWPAYMLDCFGKSPKEAFTFLRCFQRMPARPRAAWDARLDAIVTKAGGKASGATGKVADGPTFEEVCAGFVAEMARLDDCAGPGMYVPDFEQVYEHGRAVAVDGVIPADKVDALRARCSKQELAVRKIELSVCRGTLLPPQ